MSALDPFTSSENKRKLLRAMFDAAVTSAHPDHCLARHLPAAPHGRIVVLAAGKGAAAMAAAAERYYLDELHFPPERFTGLATTRHGHGVPTRRVGIIEAGHPVPDEASQRAADETLRLAATTTHEDLVLVLLSGGGSANWIAPADGVSFAQKQAITRQLLRSGAPIGDINAVRKHLSRIKGGRLARAAAPARILTFAISDVPHDDPAVIASGPTVPDPTTLADARDVLQRYGIAPDEAILRALRDPANESCKSNDPAFAKARFTLLARPRDAIDAAINVATDAGYEVRDLGECEGEARDVAAGHAQIARAARSEGKRIALISGGELTVTVRGGGRGGPNQEYALSLLAALGDMRGIASLAADTDGADGGGGAPTDPAGAFADAQAAQAARAQGLEATTFLADNDATGFFERTGSLLLTGPTLTNVNDLRVILIDPGYATRTSF